MRILIVSHSGGSPYHGPNMRSYHLARVMRREGHDVRIVSSSQFHKYSHPPRTTGPVTHEIIDGIPYAWVRTMPYRGRGARQVLNQLDFVRACFVHHRDIVQGPCDVVVASSPHPFVAYFAMWVARRLGARFVFETRDLWPLAIRELGGFSRFHPYVLALGAAERAAVRRADRVVSVKPGDGEYFRDVYGLPPERFAWVANGFDTSTWIERPLPESLAGRLPSGGFTVGYVGAVSAYYGLGALVEAAERMAVALPDVHVVVAGSGSELGELQGRVREGRLTFLGQVDRADVPALLARFDVCFVGLRDIEANRHGISCNKIFEYMYAQKPILASYATRFDPVAEAGCGLTVAPQDPEAIAHAVERLVRMPAAERDAMGQRGRAYFERHHAFSVLAARYVRALSAGALADGPEEVPAAVPAAEPAGLRLP